jgi:hypothetical protein
MTNGRFPETEIAEFRQSYDLLLKKYGTNTGLYKEVKAILKDIIEILQDMKKDDIVNPELIKKS